jgi:transposase
MEERFLLILVLEGLQLKNQTRTMNNNNNKRKKRKSDKPLTREEELLLENENFAVKTMLKKVTSLSSSGEKATKRKP